MTNIVETSYFGNLKQVEEPKVLIIPTPYEYTTSFIKGTKNGPQAILNASMHLEQFDEELWTSISDIGINTSSFVNCEFVNNKSKEPFIELEQVVRTSVISGTLPIVIGGEHSITYGAMKAIYDLYTDVSILYINSRPNLMESFQNNTFNYHCTMRQLYEAMPDLKVTQLGIKSLSSLEANWLENNDINIEICFAKDYKQWKIADILSNLTKNVYISFGFNVFDSSIMPSSILPEPGGMTWDTALDIIKNVSAFKEIVGMDFVGLSPINSFSAPNLLAAKLIYKSIGYTFARQLGAFEEDGSALVNTAL